ncbi:MAG TPA: peptide chain release factor N(5)-glutamine methyltransferase [Candidatus Acidoferrales bacterium]|nr:peptide chain release factor N(5)-glutamine methyltransferase [Candidatus Acidoferrales bacterium]
MDVRTTLQQAMADLERARVPSHGLAAELLLLHALGRDRAWLYAHPEEEIPPGEAESFSRMVARRAAGTPTQYLTGKQEFWDIEFSVGPGVLIPRPETEHVVEVALDRLKSRRPPDDSGRGLRRERLGRTLRIVDVGTGSGCLAVALAREIPEARIWATDISRAALAIAWHNSVRYDLEARIELIEASLLTPFLLGGQSENAVPFDLIVSNPPYVARSEFESLARELREHEPKEALLAGETGLEVFRPLIRQAEKVLTPGGALVLEVGAGQAAEVRALFGEFWKDISVIRDLAGIERVVSALRV